MDLLEVSGGGGGRKSREESGGCGCDVGGAWVWRES